MSVSFPSGQIWENSISDWGKHIFLWFYTGLPEMDEKFHPNRDEEASFKSIPDDWHSREAEVFSRFLKHTHAHTESGVRCCFFLCQYQVRIVENARAWGCEWVWLSFYQEACFYGNRCSPFMNRGMSSALDFAPHSGQPGQEWLPSWHMTDLHSWNVVEISCCFNIETTSR